MIARRSSAALLATVLLTLACASGGGQAKSKSASAGTGNRVLKGIVVEREREAPGEGGASYQSTGNYYLVFEVREGDATARYRFQVTYQQWFRFPEGSAVQITLRNNFLQDVKADSGS
jgi:hypothetical protein